MRHFGIWLVVGVLGCTNGEKSDSPGVRVFSEAVTAPGTSGRRDKHLGEDCTANGASDCESGLCLKLSESPFGGWVCSQACGSLERNVSCPRGWECHKTLPDPDGFTCVPALDGGAP